LSQGEFLSKAVETPKVWRADFQGQPIIEFEAWVSTEAMDRDGEIIRINGWHKPSLQRAKLLLFHDYDELAIGKPYWTRAKDENGKKGLYTRGRMGPQMHGLAVGELYFNGDMDSFSVGFNWFKRIFDEEGDGIKKPFYEYIDQELYEYSAVNVPANPEALIAYEQMLVDAGDVKDAMAIIKSFNKQSTRETINRDSYIIKESMKENHEVNFV
jgi:HK97 family phage prohead protease